jgi:cytochrome b involved in lipid metabolism
MKSSVEAILTFSLVFQSIEASAWIIIHGKVYDVTEFIHKHPGGSEMMLLSAGRDCTDLFESYHAFHERARSYLASYEIGMYKIKFFISFLVKVIQTVGKTSRSNAKSIFPFFICLRFWLPFFTV